MLHTPLIAALRTCPHQWWPALSMGMGTSSSAAEIKTRQQVQTMAFLPTFPSFGVSASWEDSLPRDDLDRLMSQQLDLGSHLAHLTSGI